MRTQRLIAYAFAACLILLVTGSAMAERRRGQSEQPLAGHVPVHHGRDLFPVRGVHGPS